MALDTLGNIWISSSSSTTDALVEISPTGSFTTFSVPTGNASEGIAIDGNNDVFLGTISAAKIGELKAGTGTISFSLFTNGTPGNPVYSHLYTMAIDSNLNLWVAANKAGAFGVAEFPATCTSACTPTSSANYTTAPVAYTTTDAPYAIAIDKNNVPWVTESANNILTELNGSPTSDGTSTAVGLGGIDANSAASTIVADMAMDGASNIWIANNGTPNTVSEIAAGSTTTALSPSTGFSVTSPVSFSSPNFIAIDQAGNVWVSNNNTTNGTNNYPLTEIVGAAVPAVQPLAEAVALGKIGQRP
jgi:streptogramin lyase